MRRLLGVQQIYEAPLLSTGPEFSPGSEFENLFREHYPRLVKTLLRLVGNPGQAEELAADAFYRLHQHRRQNGSEENLAGWLYRTAMNLGLERCVRMRAGLIARSRRILKDWRRKRPVIHSTSCWPMSSANAFAPLLPV